MTVLSVDVIWQGESGGRALGAVRRRKRRFRVITDEYMDPDLILRDPRVPKDGDFLPSDNGQFCNDIEIEPEGSSRIAWVVTATYTNDVDAQELEISKKGGTGEPPNPFDDPIELEFDSGQSTRPVVKSQSGAPIDNAAGDLYDPPPDKIVMRPVMVVIRNEPTFSWATSVLPIANKINSKEFSGAKPRTVFCARVAARREFERNVPFWKVRREFWYDEDGWDLKLNNVGFYTAKRVAASPGEVVFANRERIRDANGLEVQIPQPLTALGELAVPGTDGKIEATFREFQIYGEADFNSLNFGSGF